VRRVRRARRPLVALVALIVALAVGYGIKAARSDDPAKPSRSGTAAQQTQFGRAGVPLSSLPVQVATTVHLIERGGPFPYPRNDGVVFHNAEHHLPSQSDGYYREYTVPTPKSPDRGAARIITGSSGEFWYTADHYESFTRVDVSK
jgi:ribonuclease T1